MKLVYFAWVRERVGKTDEQVSLPQGVETVADLVRWLKGRGEEYEYAFENEGILLMPDRRQYGMRVNYRFGNSK